MRRIVTRTTTALLPILMGLLAVAASVDARTVATGTDITTDTVTREAYEALTAAKPRNGWTTDTLADAGFPGCTPIDWTAGPDATAPAPSAHVVRVPAAEGYRWTLMAPAEVAERMEGFGGTATTADDVKMVANCR